MVRPGIKPWVSMLVLALVFSTLFQAALQGAGAQIQAEPAGQVRHFDAPEGEWSSRLGPDRDLQLVVGPDSRQQITPTNVRPYQSIAYLEAWDEETGLAISCTATFIGPTTLLTAAHCLWVDEFGGWPDGVVVAPGKDGESNPFGYELAADIWVPNGWANESGNSSRRFQWDFGLVKLGSTAMADKLGTLEIGVFSDATLQRSDLHPTTSGYPGDKPWGTQWTSTESAFDKVTGTHLINSIDAFQGQSGSAIWARDDGRIIGIVSFETRTTNYALRIDQRVVDGLSSGCFQLKCEFAFSVEESESPPPTEPTVEPTPVVPPLPPPSTVTPEPTPDPSGIDTAAFDATWARTDLPVSSGAAGRTWMWGPVPFTESFMEPYADAPDGERAVIYYDKSRMELTNPDGDPTSPWYITNGLLVVELVTGELQTGNDSFEPRQPAQINVAGDGNDASSPTYASFAAVLDAPALAEGESVTQRLDRAGNVSNDLALASRGVTAGRYVPQTNHTVASVFWDFMTSQGTIYENGGLTSGPLFSDPFYATGLPISEPYWATVQVGGQEKDVLIQAFERRVLTYTPDNPEGWQVEAGNVGQHYYTWRYEQIPKQ